MKSIRVLDSHTGGEPTRLVLDGGPELGTGPLDERAARFRRDFDAYRSAIVNEPRGSDTVVGALLVPPHRAGCDFGVIFFNNVGVLGMCGHGTIGLVVALAHLGRIAPGIIKIDTPVGAVTPSCTPTAPFPSRMSPLTATLTPWISLSPATASCAAMSRGVATGSSL